MVCDHCKTKVEKALSVLDGVTKVKINLHDKRKEMERFFIYTNLFTDSVKILTFLPFFSLF